MLTPAVPVMAVPVAAMLGVARQRIDHDRAQARQSAFHRRQEGDAMKVENIRAGLGKT
jgi:hypothetical protein